MSEEDPFAENDTLIAEQERREASPPMVCVRDIRLFVEVSKPKEENTVRVTLCVDIIEEHPKLWCVNFVDAALSDRRVALKARTKCMDRTMRNSVIFQVTMWKPRKRPLGGVNCPYHVGDVITVGKIHKLRLYVSLLQGEVETEDWMTAQ